MNRCAQRTVWFPLATISPRRERGFPRAIWLLLNGSWKSTEGRGLARRLGVFAQRPRQRAHPPAEWRRVRHIDWSDTAFTDPACDFALLYRDLGPTVLEASLERYTRAHSAEKGQIRRRAHFYGRWRAREHRVRAQANRPTAGSAPTQATVAAIRTVRRGPAVHALP